MRLLWVGWVAVAAQVASLVLEETGHTATAVSVMSSAVILLWIVILRLQEKQRS